MAGDELEVDIIQVCRRLKENIDRDREYLQYIKRKYDKTVKHLKDRVSFWEGLVEGQEVLAYNIYKGFKELEREDLAKAIKEIFELKEEKSGEVI